MQEAYHDPNEPNNQRFVYVSETCVPLVHPDRLYEELTADLSVTYMDKAKDPLEDHDRYRANGNGRALQAAGIRPTEFFKHSGWFCPCRADAKRLLARKPAFVALNRVKAGDEHILSILNRDRHTHPSTLVHKPVTYVDWSQRHTGVTRYQPDAPGFWDQVDHEPDPVRKQTLIDLIQQWKHDAMHPRTFRAFAPADLQTLETSGALLVRKVDRKAHVPWGADWLPYTARARVQTKTAA